MIKYFILFIFFTNLFGFEAYIDDSNKLSFEEILKKQTEFQDKKGQRYSFGYSDTTIWIKEKLENKEDSPKEIILKINPFYLEHVSAYLPESSTLQLSFLQNKAYKITLAPHTYEQVYFKIESKTNKSIILEQYENFNSYIKKLNLQNFYATVVIVTISVLFFFNLFIYLFTKQKSYLYYLFYLFFLFIYQFFVTGMNQLFENYPTFYINLTSVGINGTMIFMIIFISHITNLKKHLKVLYKFLIGVNIAFVLNFLYLIFVNYQEGAYFRASFLTPILFTSITITIFYTLKKEPVVKYIFLGWLALVSALSIRTLIFAGYLPNTIFLQNLFPISIVIEAFLFSAALSYQFNILKQKEIQLIKENTDKDTIIKRQTKFALVGQILFGIEHQWRKPINYLASISASLQSKLFLNKIIKQEEIKEALVQIDKTIDEIHQTMSDFRRIYSPDSKPSKENLKEVIIETVEYFKKFTQIGIPIEYHLILDDISAITYPNAWRHIVLNLLQNSLDAAKRNNLEKLSITIELLNLQSSYSFSVVDNANGASSVEEIFEPFYSQKSDGLSGIGLFIVHQIIVERLGGTINAKNTSDGLSITVLIGKNDV